MGALKGGGEGVVTPLRTMLANMTVVVNVILLQYSCSENYHYYQFIFYFHWKELG